MTTEVLDRLAALREVMSLAGLTEADIKQKFGGKAAELWLHPDQDYPIPKDKLVGLIPFDKLLAARRMTRAQAAREWGLDVRYIDAWCEGLLPVQLQFAIKLLRMKARTQPATTETAGGEA